LPLIGADAQAIRTNDGHAQAEIFEAAASGEEP